MKKQENKFNPTQFYFMIAAGICLVALRLIDWDESWSIIDVIKAMFGLAMIAFGTFKLIKK